MNPENSNPPPETAPAPAPRANLRVIGLGNAGAQLVERLREMDLPETFLAVVNSDKAALADAGVTEKLEISAKWLGAHGHRSEPGRTELDAQESALKPLCEGAETVAIVAGLGGRAGTQLSLSLARAAKQSGAHVLAFVTMPFDCEGSVRYSKARQALDRLRAVADMVFCLPNQRVAGQLDEATNLADAYAVPARLMVECVRAVLHAGCASTLMGLQFPDICALLKERHAETVFAVAQSEGADRAANLVKQLTEHPLLRGGRALAETDGLSLCVLGGPDLRVADVNQVMQQLGRHSHNAPMVMGAGVNPAFAGKLTGVLLVSAPPQSSREASSETPLENPHAVAPTGTENFEEHFDPRAVQTGGRALRGGSPGHETPSNTTGRGAGHRARRSVSRLRQGQLPLDLAGKGRFEKSEPNIHKGEDLDQPTFIRRGVALN